jgi:response regulator NasT
MNHLYVSFLGRNAEKLNYLGALQQNNQGSIADVSGRLTVLPVILPSGTPHATESVRRNTTMSKSILICDDEPLIRLDLKSMLVDLGFDEILECGDGEKAVEMALGCFPDMAILDVAMPGMDGISAAVEIKKKLKIPIMLLTSACDSATVKRAAASGIAAFLTKPLRQQDLLPAIEMSLQHVEEVEDLKEKIDDLRELIENRKIIEKAKGIVMEKSRVSEAEAYRMMQKTAMDKRKTLLQVAAGILKEG